MACLKCGNLTKDGETLCEKCRAEANEFDQSHQTITAETVQQSSITETGTNKPNKKKVNKIVIAAACVIAVLIGVFAVCKLFFNRDFSQLIMGKNNYAKNVELLTAKESMNHIIRGVNSYDSAMKIWNKNNTMEVNTKCSIKLDEKYLQSLNMSAEQVGAIQQIVKYLNSLKFDRTTIKSEKGIKSSLVITDPVSLNFSIDSFIYNNGNSYLHIRKLWDQYIALQQKQESISNILNLYNLKFDSVKLKASLEKLAAIYSETIATADIKAEDNQSITIDGEVVQGQKLTACLDSKKTAKMVQTIAKAIKSDEYLYTFISENTNNSKKLTKADYEKLIDDTIAKLENINSTFSAISYLAPNGTLLAHTYAMKKDADEIKLNFLISDKKYAVEFSCGKESFTIANTKTGANGGNLQLKLKQDNFPKNIGFNISYSNLKKVKIFGEEYLIGKYEITFYDPDHLIKKELEKIGMNNDKIDQTKITFEITPNGENKAKAKMQLSIPKILVADCFVDASLTNSNSEIISEPSGGQVINIKDLESEEMQTQMQLNTLYYLYFQMDENPQLKTILSYFGITKEYIETIFEYYQIT